MKSALAGAELVYNINQAYQAAAKLSNIWQQPVLIQNHIEGDEYMVAALFDTQGNIIQTLPARKHLVNPLGKSAITVTIDNPKLNTVAQQILDNLSWVDPLD